MQLFYTQEMNLASGICVQGQAQLLRNCGQFRNVEKPYSDGNAVAPHPHREHKMCVRVRIYFLNETVSNPTCIRHTRHTCTVCTILNMKESHVHNQVGEHLATLGAGRISHADQKYLLCFGCLYFCPALPCSTR